MLETKDLILDKARFEDWKPMYRNVWSRPESFRYMVLEPSPSPEEAQDRMRRTIAFQARQETMYTVFLKSTGEAIGFGGMQQVENTVWEERGLCLGPDFWGRGYGQQLLNCLLAQAKARGGRTFLYSVWEENAASRRLADKAGFALYAVEQHTRPYDGRRYTLLKYQKEL